MKYLVDFDNTLRIETGDLKGQANQPLIDALIRKQKAGAKIILWTHRIKKAKKWCKKRGLKFDKIIKNKPEFDLVIDDKAIRPLWKLDGTNEYLPQSDFNYKDGSEHNT